MAKARKLSKATMAKLYANREAINLYRDCVIATIEKDSVKRNAIWEKLYPMLEEVIMGYASTGSIAKGVRGKHQETKSYLSARTTDQHYGMSKAKREYGTKSYTDSMSVSFTKCADSHDSVFESLSTLFIKACERAASNSEIHFRKAYQADSQDYSFYMFVRKIAIHCYGWNKFANRTDPNRGYIAPDHLGTNDVNDAKSVTPDAICGDKEEANQIIGKVWAIIRQIKKSDLVGWALWAAGNRKGRRSAENATDANDFWSVMGVQRAMGFIKVKAINAKFADLIREYDTMGADYKMQVKISEIILHSAEVIVEWKA